VTVRGAGTFAHPVGITGVGGRQVLSIRLDGSHVPMMPPPPLDEPPLDEPPLDELLPPEELPFPEELVPDDPPFDEAPPDDPPVLEAPPLLDVPPPEEPPALDEPFPDDPPVLDVPAPDEPLPPDELLLVEASLPEPPLLLLDMSELPLPLSEEPQPLTGRNATAPSTPTYAKPRIDISDSYARAIDSRDQVGTDGARPSGARRRVMRR
jgi:hypothetical protein